MTSEARTLYIDIETSPNVADVWGLWNQTVSLSQLRESSRVISFAAKWRGEPKRFFFSEFHNSQEVMLDRAHGLLDEADVVSTWNGRKFDIPTLNKEFILAGMSPPAPYIQLDLLAEARKNFRFPSNKLDYVSKALLGKGKVSHMGHDLWVQCLAGNAKAWALMKKYNIQDVVLLEEVHDVLRPWINGGMNARLFSGFGCPTCGPDGIPVKRGFVYLRTGMYQRYRCNVCTSWSRDTKRYEGTDLVMIDGSR